MLISVLRHAVYAPPPVVYAFSACRHADLCERSFLFIFLRSPFDARYVVIYLFFRHIVMMPRRRRYILRRLPTRFAP